MPYKDPLVCVDEDAVNELNALSLGQGIIMYPKRERVGSFTELRNSESVAHRLYLWA